MLPIPLKYWMGSLLKNPVLMQFTTSAAWFSIFSACCMLLPWDTPLWIDVEEKGPLSDNTLFSMVWTRSQNFSYSSNLQIFGLLCQDHGIWNFKSRISKIWTSKPPGASKGPLSTIKAKISFNFLVSRLLKKASKFGILIKLNILLNTQDILLG